MVNSSNEGRFPGVDARKVVAHKLQVFCFLMPLPKVLCAAL